MAKTKISVIARNLNVGLNTVTDFLRKKNIEVEDNNPNFRVEDDVTELLVKEFGGGGKKHFLPQTRSSIQNFRSCGG